ncbi:integrin alpha-M-like [Astyanax mexicanus]|uniref:Integrin alpha-M-like n=1 Tax=Astyanax mexicanus TaxID=7994 RepID=A0A8T2LBQ3_ASTMX|nr:integrin alpha-M-like [Astyanax mexicanus]
MDWNLPSFLLLISVSQSAAFNLDSSPWKNYPQNPDTAFGYKVIQRDRSLIVSDPLIQNGDKRGKVYSCGVTDGRCSPLTIKEPSEAVNMSLGLSMTKDPKSSKIIACGPTIPKNCRVVTTYNGMCFTVDRNSNVEGPIPSALRDCPVQPIDIAFLLDGSGSVRANDFTKMKTFVELMVQGLITRDIRFAVAQYSNECEIHIDFTYQLNSNLIQNIRQKGGGTNTASAINKLVDDLFNKNPRAKANRVLVVITDGQSHDARNLRRVAAYAQQNKIIRYAIGVGNAFNNEDAEKELNTIASDPPSEYKFKVDSFSVLNRIKETLEKNIIAIEGTQTSGDSTRMEFAQDGFSAEFNYDGKLLLSAVGAYQWKGGYQEYSSTGPSGDFQEGIEHDSYLGYSMTVARTPFINYVIQAAPRHGHIGKVFISTSMALAPLNPPVKPQLQIGSYFGAEVCAVDLDVDSFTDLLLVSAPLFTQASKEGIVFVYSVPGWANYWSEPIMTLEGMAGQRGRFGSSLASPGDLNGDKITDVVVGAPLEDFGQGSVYIFNGQAGGIASTYSQRISGSSVQSGLRFFGLSLSQNALDQSEDGLLDIAVGSKGAAMLFRSRPIVSLVTTVTYNPKKIPPKETECEKPLENTVTVCFRLTEQNTRGKDLKAKLNYDLKLDAKRQTFRAFFQDKPKKERVLTDEMVVGLSDACKKHSFFIESCTEDALNPLSNELTFTFEGLPSISMQALTPILHPDIRNTSDHNLDFEINCGTDNICIDDLKVDFNFSGHSDIQVGIMQEMNVTVFVENRGENSYNPQVMLTYPFGLSYRRFTSKQQGRVECVSVDSDQPLALGKTTCYISKPILRQSSFAVFEITYSIHKDSNFDKLVTFSATASSGNDQHAVSSKLDKIESIAVKYAIYIALIRHENSSIHINFTAGKNNQEKPISQILKVFTLFLFFVENDLRDVNLTVLISVPIKLGEKDIWTNKNLQISGCSSDRDEKPTVTDFVEAIKIKPLVNCSVATCRRFRCNTNILKRGVELYIISAKVSSGWIEQTGLTAAVFELVSSATLDYDKNKYVYVSSDSQHNAPIVTINTQVEVYEEKNLLKEIIGGVIGGLVLLALITAGLYKAGFFKSQYKQMLEDAGGEETAAPDGETPEE